MYKRNRMLILFLAMIMLISVIPISAATLYDPVAGKDWSYPYAQHLQAAGIIDEIELNTYDPTAPVTALEAMKLITKTQKDAGKIDFYWPGWDEDSELVGKLINRGELANLLVTCVDPDTMFDRNAIDYGDIPDVSEDTHYCEEIYTVYRWGLISGIDAVGTYNFESLVTKAQLYVVVDRILNPNIRTNLEIYGDDVITIKTDSYPMSYSNESKGLSIEITKENHFEAVCYVAHVTMKNPAHLKTVYSYREWSNKGLPISEVNKDIDSILMVNGDFRSVSYGEDNGIIRNRQVVNNILVNGIGLYMDGTIKEVKSSPSQLLSSGVRDTFTFGPVLVRDGKIIPEKNDTRHPRTFIGQIYREDDTLEYYIIVADGRWPDYSMGLTNYEMASILKDNGCDFGYNIDGGGSSCMNFLGKTLNKPSDGRERYDVDYIFIK